MDLLPKSGNLKELSKSDAFFKIILFLFYSDAKNKANGKNLAITCFTEIVFPPTVAL